MQIRLIILLFTFVGFLVSFIVLSPALAAEKGDTDAEHFLAYMKMELFSESPISPEFLKEYKTAPWSWDVSQIVRSYRTKGESGQTLIEIIAESMPDVYEYTRFTEEEALQNEQKAYINRYHLDFHETDRVRYFSKTFMVPFFFGVRFFRLKIIT